MAEVIIRTMKNGPLLVQGRVELNDAAGNRIETEKDSIALCRCGASLTKPFCDGTHSQIEFQTAEAAGEIVCTGKQ